MPSSLQLLMRLQTRAFFRKQRMNLREPRKAIMMVMVYALPLGFFSLFVVAHLIVPSEETTFFADARELLPLVLGCFLLLPVISAMYELPFVYTPSEIQFLFPAPFTQRQLAAYKMAIFAAGTLPLAMFFSLAFAGANRGWPTAFLGLSLFLWFSSATTCLASLLFRMPWIRFVLYAGLLALGGIGVRDALDAAPSFQRDFSFSGIGTSLTAQIVSWPAQPFANVMTLSVANGGWWIAVTTAVAAVVTTTALTLALIGNFQESLVVASRRREERLARMRAGNFFAGSSWALSTRLRLRMLPRLGGLGPILYAGLTGAARSKGYLITLTGLFFLSAAFGLVVRNEWMGANARGAHTLATGVGTQVAIFSLMWIRYDLRGRFGLLDYFKTLPVHPGAFASGAVLASALATFCVQSAPVLGYGLTSGTPLFSWWFLLLLFPANVIWLAIDNAVFLRAPSALRLAGTPDPAQVGREILSMFIKAAALGVVALVCAAAYGLTWIVSGSPTAGWIVAWLIGACCAAGACVLTGVAFRNLDLGRDRL